MSSITVGSTASACTLVVLAALVATAQAGPTFHGNAARTGVYASAGPTRAPAVQWTFKAAGPIVTSPAVLDGVVYMGSMSGHLYAIDQQTGKEKWNFKSRMPIASSPAVADGTVFFRFVGRLAGGDRRRYRTAEVGLRVRVRAQVRSQGTCTAIRRRRRPMPDAWDVFTSSPAVVDGKVYFGSGDGNVYAVDAATGVLQWKFATAERRARFAGRRRRHGLRRQLGRPVLCHRCRDGQQKWMFAGGQDDAIHNQVGFQSSPAVVDGTSTSAAAMRTSMRSMQPRAARSGTTRPANRGSTARRRCATARSTSARPTARASWRSMREPGRLQLQLRREVLRLLVGGAGRRSRLLRQPQRQALRRRCAKRRARLGIPDRGRRRRDPSTRCNADGSLNQESFAPVFGDFQDMYVDFYRYIRSARSWARRSVDRGVLYVGSMDGNLYALRVSDGR